MLQALSRDGACCCMCTLLLLTLLLHHCRHCGSQHMQQALSRLSRARTSPCRSNLLLLLLLPLRQCWRGRGWHLRRKSRGGCVVHEVVSLGVHLLLLALLLLTLLQLLQVLLLLLPLFWLLRCNTAYAAGGTQHPDVPRQRPGRGRVSGRRREGLWVSFGPRGITAEQGSGHVPGVGMRSCTAEHVHRLGGSCGGCVLGQCRRGRSVNVRRR